MSGAATARESTSVRSRLERNQATRELREIDNAAILAPVTTDANDDEAEIVENVTRDEVHAKLEEMQKTVARLSLGDDDNVAQADQVRLSGPRVRSHPPASPRTLRPPWTKSTSARRATASGRGALGPQPPDKSSVFWFRYKIVEERHPWAFVQRSPKRRIAALEMLGTLVLAAFLFGKNDRDERLPIIPLLSDNQGNVYSLLDSLGGRPDGAYAERDGLYTPVLSHLTGGQAGQKTAPPLQRYAKVCQDCGLQPQQAVVGFLGQKLPFLDLRGLGYSDEDLLALAAAFPYTGTLERLDLGQNSKLTNRSVCPLLECVAARFADMLAALYLDKCIQIGREAMQLLTQLILGPMVNLQRLDISGVYVSIADYQKLAGAIERHERLQEVSLARTGISPDLSTKIIPSLVRNTRILKLDLGYNNFDPEAFTVLGNSLLKGSRLEYLGLAKTASVMASVPMCGFLEQLPADRCLKFLDLSDNQLDESSALMLEYGFLNHPTIELLDVSTNPLGQNGLCALLRLLSNEQCPELCNLLLEDVQTASDGDVALGLFDVDPSGQYSLDMAMAGQRTCFRLLLTNLAQLGGSRSQYIKSAMLTSSSTQPPTPYNVDGVRKRRGVWNVPTSGILSFVLSLNDYFLKDEGDNSVLYSEVVERMLLKRKRTWASKKKTFAVLQKVNSMEGPLFDAFLMALLRDFHLNKDQVMAIYMNQGDKAKETLIRMLPAIIHPRALLHAARNTDSIKDILDFERSARAPLSLNLENPTGHYALRLEHLPTRSVVQKLLLLNRWQLHLWRKANLVDVSIDGKGKCLRNALLDGKSLSFSDADWRIPPQGLLTFDFVALYRPPAAAKPIPIETWGNVLAALQVELAPKKKEDMKVEEDPQSSLKISQAIWALRGISSRVWILSRQLRNLLCVFLHRDDRATVLCMMFLRCVDWPINGKLSTKVHETALEEMSFHTIDLAQWEQRRCLHTLVRLSNAEDAVNIKNPVMDKDANPNAPAFQPFVAGIPNSWAEWDNVPAQGIMQCTYNCAVDRQNLKVRRRLAATIGGWAHLPDTAFDFWSCLEDVPPEVLKVVVFMIRNWKSTDAAFTALNTQPDNMLNHKEFVDGLAKAGCCRTRRPKIRTMTMSVALGSRGLPGSPSGTEPESEDTGQLEALSSVFRYLDTSHDGDISRREFETLERVWLKNDLEIFYGSLTKAFEAIDQDESGAISFEEFRKCVEATQFDGPVTEIFMFVDMNGDQEIDGEEFFILEEYSHAPPLPDFTDAKTAKMASRAAALLCISPSWAMEPERAVLCR
ncbi:unnamed protein product [Symbiodinium sp. KB8]|nr:unnamed protein product [Symbiodinium sp. KB8]